MEKISDPEYWKERLKKANELHKAIFICPIDRWNNIEATHRQILAKVIGENDSILDAGCGYGRLISLLPDSWKGDYLGIDISPDFIQLAQETYPDYHFTVGNLRHIREMKPSIGDSYDWAVCISMVPMIRRNLGGEVWDDIEKQLLEVAKKILILEYDVQALPVIIER